MYQSPVLPLRRREKIAQQPRGGVPEGTAGSQAAAKMED